MSAIFNSLRLERIWIIAKTDFKRRYSSDYFGVLWAILNPIMRMSIYYFVFKKVFQVQRENYVLILFSGIITWMVFREITTRGLNILSAKRYLLENIQFNHIDIYIANAIAVCIGFMFNFTAYNLLAIYMGVSYGSSLLWLPVIILIMLCMATGVSMILSILNLFFKDIKHFWTVVLLFGFWTSGIFERTDLFVEAFPPIKYLNPFIGIIHNIRQMVLYNGPINIEYLLMNSATAIVVLVAGIFIYNKYSAYAIEKR